MHLHRIDTTPQAAGAILRNNRARLCACIVALQAQPDDVFVRDFPVVVTAVEAGFRHEEALLERLGDAGMHLRRADYAVLLRALHRMQPRVEEGDVALGRQVADALAAVLSLPWDTLAPPRRTETDARSAPAAREVAPAH